MLVVCLLVALIARIEAATTSCNLQGFYRDLQQTLPYPVTLELISRQVDGEAVPDTLSVTVPNPKNGLYYTEAGPGASPQATCEFPELDTNLFKTLGFAYVTAPAAPVNLILWHFYRWRPEQIERILPNDPGWNDCSWVPSAEITAPGVFFSPPECVPLMGAHWFPNKMNIFDPASLIPVWGTYNRTVHFYEYASLDDLWTVLETAPNYESSGTYPLPRWPQVSGWYPASVKIELVDSTFNDVRMTVYNFQYLWSAEDWNILQENRYLDGVNDGQNDCNCDLQDCDGAFAVVVQFATIVLPFLFYLF
jgi:hypothetical protein